MLINILPSILSGAILGACMSWAVTRTMNKKNKGNYGSNYPKSYFDCKESTYVKIPIDTLEITMQAYQPMDEKDIKEKLLDAMLKNIDGYVQITSFKINDSTSSYTARLRVVPETKDMYLVP